MKKILLLSGTKTPEVHVELFHAIKKSIQKNQIHYAFFNDLEFSIISNNAVIFDSRNNLDLRDYDMVIFRVHHSMHLGEAIACAHYLKHHDKHFWDQKVIHNAAEDKLSQNFIFALNSISIPDTIYSSDKKKLLDLLKRHKENLQFPVILKDSFGKKGRENYLVKNLSELESILQQSQRTKLLIQKFIPVRYDYRFLVMDHEIRYITKRIKCKANDHRSNICLGNQEETVKLNKIDPLTQKKAIKISKLLKLNLTGIDLIIDPENQKHYFLEANSAPGFTIKPEENQKEVKELFKFIDQL